ncbi:Solute carrier family 35 member G1 [Halotydeus destructor]|nr:Solute carrier family 35 member G1 [Halotydeus destructor]
MAISNGSVSTVSTTQPIVENHHDSAIVRKLRPIPLAGLMMAILSAVIFATASFTVKLMPAVHPVEVVISRSIIQLLVFAPAILLTGGSFKAPKGERWPLFLRGAFGFTAFGLAYSSLHLIPLGDSSTIVFSSPVYVSIFACILIGEACGLFQVVVIAITLSGVILISKPTFIFGVHESVADIEYRTEGTIMSFISSMATALTFVMIRKLQKTSASVVIAWFSIISIIMGIIVLTGVYVFLDQDHLIRFPTDFTMKEWLLLLVNGLCGVAGQFSLTIALKIEEAGVVSLARTTDIIVAFIYQVSFLAEPVHWTSLVGAAIVMLGVCVSGVRRILLERQSKAQKQADQRQIQEASDVVIEVPNPLAANVTPFSYATTKDSNVK